MSNTTKFTADHGLCLTQEEGLDIRINGKLHGTGGHVKDCFWAGYTHKGKCYLSLNNYPGSFWEVSEEEMMDYIND